MAGVAALDAQRGTPPVDAGAVREAVFGTSDLDAVNLVQRDVNAREAAYVVAFDPAMPARLRWWQRLEQWLRRRWA